MRCFKCNKINEPVVAFVNVTNGNFLDRQDTGIRVFMCKKCIFEVFKEQGIQIP